MASITNTLDAKRVCTIGGEAVMGALIEITEVSPPASGDQGLLGFFVDGPKQGSVLEAQALDIAGWVLGATSRAVAVEVMHQGRVVASTQAGQPRPDLVDAFPGHPDAARAGFEVSVRAMWPNPDVEVTLRAVLADGRRAPLATVRGRRRWRATLRAGDTRLVSVIIPCRDQAHFLNEAIDSVVAQTYPHLEIVVIDDGSTDDTAEVARSYEGVRCKRQRHQGLSIARNAGIRSTIGEYLLFLDVDDRLLPDAIQTHLNAFDAHPASAAVVGHHVRVDAEGVYLPTPPQPNPGLDSYASLLRTGISNSSMAILYRREIFEAGKGFDPTVGHASHYALLLRATRDHPVHWHGEVVVECQQRADSTCADPTLMRSNFVKVLRSQRSYVQHSTERKRALRDGMRSWRRSHGVPP